jgi:NAD(P)-dependent dehydrogenase (short-subunit alcohol dehydrogenase family)
MALLLLALPVGACLADSPTVLITGSNKGIGLELVHQYAARGWQVIATTRKPEDAAELKAFAATHANVRVEALDVADHSMIDGLATRMKDKPLDILINNAGMAGSMGGQRFGKFDYASFRNTLEVNAVGPLKLSEAFAPNLRLGTQKKIVLLGTSEASFAGIDAARLYFYRSSKAAAHMLMLNLAYELKPQGIAVAVVNPGPVDTDMMKGVRMPLQPPAIAVAKVIGIIDGVNLANTGKFWNYSGGFVAW